MTYHRYCILLILVLIAACKTDKAKVSEEAEPDVLQKISRSHGLENWAKVKEIRFTFNVDRDTSHFERSWIWNRAENKVTRIMGNDTVGYFRNAVDSTVAQVDAGFINDKYWLLAPFNLSWDRSNFSFDHQLNAVAPISQKPMQKLTIVYGGQGGYTPGDAYDFYFEDDHVLKEWVFREANQEDPSLITTWEGYKSLSGLLISTMHKNDNGSFVLSFSDVSVQ